MNATLEIISIISLLFMITIHIQFWMMKKQIDRVDAIVCRFHTMFSNAYQVVSEDELQDIMNNVAPVKDDEDIIKKWDEGN